MSLFFHYLSLPYLLEGIELTLEVTCLGLIGGLLMGLVLTSMQLSRFWLLAAVARGYAVIFRGTPLILQMVFAYDALPHIGITLSAVAAAGLALAANEAPFIAEMLRAGVIGVDRGQILGRAGARHDPRRPDAPDHRPAGDPHHDPGIRQRIRQRTEEFVARVGDCCSRTDLAQHAACVVDIRLLLDLLRSRIDLFGADRRDSRHPAHRRGAARSRPAVAAGAAGASVAVAACRPRRQNCVGTKGCARRSIKGKGAKRTVERA